MIKAIAYTRKSTDTNESQVHSLQAQKKEILDYARKNNIEIVACFSESISGKIRTRPEFSKAVEMAKKQNLPIISKSLSRIGRNASQVLEIMDDIELIITDYGKSVDKDFLSLMAVINQIEVRAISKRTKSALALLKAQGVKLGNTTNLIEAQELGRKSLVNNANDFAMKLAPMVMNDIRPTTMARQLNEIGVKTQRGKKWTTGGIQNLRKRISKIKSEQK
jgi:DNA invertase Pin-like site-specific DNA recombinase